MLDMCDLHRSLQRGWRHGTPPRGATKSYAGIWVTLRDQVACVLVSRVATWSVNVMPSMSKGNWFVRALQAAPGSGGGLNELEDHQLRRLLRQRALCSYGSVPNGGEDAIDGIAGVQMVPVLGRKIIERQEGIAVFRLKWSWFSEQFSGIAKVYPG